jgi:hypothetical protein
MANKSGWKTFEKQIALALGGKRRLRTMESFGKEAPDVYWPKERRRAFPILKRVVVECKKRKSLNVHSLYVETKLKYGKGDKIIILATRVPATERGRAKFKKLKKRVGRRFGLKTKKERKKIKLAHFITPLITVELGFFQDLWNAWIRNTK